MAKRRDENAPYWQQLRVAERGIIEFALQHGETIRGTAAILGVSPNFLSERLRELGIPAPDVRPGPKPGTPRPPRPQLRVVSGDAPAIPDTLDEDDPENEDDDDVIEADLDDDGDDDDEDERDIEDEDEAAPEDPHHDAPNDEPDEDGEDSEASSQGN
jgi:hypothetical protein